jgi:hypothetical protein
MSDTASTQRIVRVYSDENGDVVTVKDDDDALDLIVIEQDNARIVMTAQQALLIVDAVRMLASTPFPRSDDQK